MSDINPMNAESGHSAMGGDLQERLNSLNTLLAGMRGILEKSDEESSLQKMEITELSGKYLELENFRQEFAEKAEFFAKREDLAELRGRCISFENKLGEFIQAGASDSEGLELKIVQLSETLNGLRDVLSSNEQGVNDKLTFLESELLKVKEMGTTSDIQEETQAQIEALDEEHVQLAEQINAVESVVANLEEDVKTHELRLNSEEDSETIQAIRSTLAYLKGEINSLTESISGLEKESAVQIDQIETDKIHLKDEFYTIHESIALLNDRTQQSVSELKAKDQDIMSQKEELELKTKRVQHELYGLNQEYGVIKEQFIQLVNGADEIDRKADENKEGFERLQSKSAQISEHLMMVQEKLEGHAEQLVDLSDLRTQLEQQSLITNQDIKHIRNEMELNQESLLSRVSELEKSLSEETQMQNADLKNEIESGIIELQNQINNDREKLGDVQSYVGHTKDELLEGLRITSDGVEQLRSRTEFLGEDLELSKERLEKTLENNAEELSLSLVENKKGLDQSKEEREEIQKRLKEDQLEIRALKDDVQKKENAIANSRHEMDLMKNRFMELREAQRNQKFAFSAVAAVLLVGLVGTFIGSDQGSAMNTSNQYAENVYKESSQIDFSNDNSLSETFTVAIESDSTDEIADPQELYSSESEPEGLIATEITETTVEVNTGESTGQGVVTAASYSEAASEMESVEYVVQKNDNLWKIAQKFYDGKGYKSKKIIKDNQLDSPDLKPGDVLRIYL